MMAAKTEYQDRYRYFKLVRESEHAESLPVMSHSADAHDQRRLEKVHRQVWEASSKGSRRPVESKINNDRAAKKEVLRDSRRLAMKKVVNPPLEEVYHDCSRDLSDTAFARIFGKSVLAAYGKDNSEHNSFNILHGLKREDSRSFPTRVSQKVETRTVSRTSKKQETKKTKWVVREFIPSNSSTRFNDPKSYKNLPHQVLLENVKPAGKTT